MTSDSSAGSSILLQNNAANGLSSSIQLATGGVSINLGKLGGLIIKGLFDNFGANNSTTLHYTYAYQKWFHSTGSYPTGSATVPAMLMIDENGNVTAGRAIYKTASTESSITNINHAVWPYVGLVGDLMFSTAD